MYIEGIAIVKVSKEISSFSPLNQKSSFKNKVYISAFLAVPTRTGSWR